MKRPSERSNSISLSNQDLVFGAGLLLELTAFIVLINRRCVFWGGLAIIALHLSISAAMQLNFDCHIAAAFIFLVYLPGLIARPATLFSKDR